MRREARILTNLLLVGRMAGRDKASPLHTDTHWTRSGDGDPCSLNPPDRWAGSVEHVSGYEGQDSSKRRGLGAVNIEGGLEGTSMRGHGFEILSCNA